MSDSESLDYLQPGFDPKSLTIPRLRSILITHNVPYSSNAKKGQLVEIFNENVVPQSKKILAARARAKRSSRGIFDAESTSSSKPFDDHEDLAPPPRPVSSRRSRSPRKTSARVKSEEPEFDPPMPPPARLSSPSKRSSRATSRQLPPSDTDTASELDTGLKPQRTRRAVTPKLKTEDSDGLFRRTSDIFTDDNPFQSGSSPPVEQTPVARRRTTGHRKSSSKHVRQTDDYGVPDDDHFDFKDESATPVPRNFRRKTPDLRYKTPEPPTVEAGEEFTPQEQLELAAEEAANGQTAVVPAQRRRQAKKTNKTTPIAMFLTIVLGAYAGWYRQEKIAVGYCGVGSTVSSIPTELEVPEWAQPVLPPYINVPQEVIDTLQPQCEPCPPHAYCYGDFTVQCEQDYILKPHPFALGGAIPLPPTCEPDGEKVRRVQAVADRAIEELRERTAKFECGELTDDEGVKAETPAIEEQQLKQIIDKKRSKKMTNQEFEELWGAAIGEVKQREEVVVEAKQQDPDSGNLSDTYLTSSSLARLPLSCAVRRYIWLGLARNRVKIGAVITLIFTVLFGKRRLISDRAEAAQVPQYVDMVLDRLAKQAEMFSGYTEEDDMDDPWLFLPNLRDDILRKYHKLGDRERLWSRIKKVVEQNSNVRTGQREGRNGEVGRAWEWVGPLSIENGSGRRRKSGRVSWGPDVKSENIKAEESPATEGDRSSLHQKWDEPRPVY
ncbi:Man1-Src1p-C-terminal domain-containing protein [Xylariaceae sp. FL0255]|nr:Man1-Src1p-C-terminal domain-containing protein [Xylariaceae sp. FL0255]